ncbi:MAG: hypothetical protein Q7S09_05410 [bacterium]|nr:hypothetical protein [bacterium]
MRAYFLMLLMLCGVFSYAKEVRGIQSEQPETVKSASLEKLEKQRKNIMKDLEQIERGEFLKLQHLRLQRERDGRNVEKFLVFFEEAEKLIADLRLAGAKPDAGALIEAWEASKERLTKILRDAKEALKKAPMREGVTKKDIQRQNKEADERSGCGKFMPMDDRYVVCKKRGLPPPQDRTSAVMKSFNPDTLRASEVPETCLGPRGPEWKFAPEVEVWKYSDALHSGPIYYVFVDSFSGLLELITRDKLTHEDILRAFIGSCREITAPGGMRLAYVGTFPMEEQNFLGVLFQNQSDHRPVGAFGMEGMTRIAHATAPPPLFTLEALLFDNTLRQFAAKSTEVITHTEELLKKLPPEAQKRFQEKLTEGVKAGKMNYVAAADAFDAVADTLKKDDPLLAELRANKTALKGLAGEFENLLIERIKMLTSDKPRSKELVFRVGERIYPFFLVTGTSLPRLRLTLRIVALKNLPPDTEVATEQPLGVLTRSYLDTPEAGSALRLYSFTLEDYQRHHLAFFAVPFVIVPVGAKAPAGEVLESSMIWGNAYLVAEAPGSYLMYLELIDDETNSKEIRKLTFAIVP